MGNLYGAAKYATLVVVKMPDFKLASMLEVLWTVFFDVMTKRRERQSVLSISWVSDRTYDYPKSMYLDTWGSDMRHIVESLELAGVTVVCAAGNYAQHYRDG